MRFASKADRQIAHILTYLQKNNPDAAQSFLDEIDESIETLTAFPEVGHPFDKGLVEDTRVLIVRSYRIFYLYQHYGETIWIVSIWHSAQEIR